MCSIACSTESTTPTASVSARYSLSQSSSPPAGRAPIRQRASASSAIRRARRRRLALVRGQLEHALVAAYDDAGLVSARTIRGTNARRQSACTSSVSAALHTPGRCVFALSTIASACVEVGRGVDVDVAVAGGRVDHGHGRDRLQRVLQALAAARDDQVDAVALRRQLGELLAPAAGHQADAPLGQARPRPPPRSRSARAPRLSAPPRRSRAARSRCPTSGTARPRRSSRSDAPRTRRRRRRAARGPCARRGRWAGAGPRSPRRPGRAAPRSA